MPTAQATESTADLSIQQVDNRPTVRSHRMVHLHCPRGRLEGAYYPASPGARAVVLAGGIGERQESPAANAFAMVAEDLQHRRVPAMRLRLRSPGDLDEIRYDLRLALRFLEGEGRREFALVGFGLAARAVFDAAALEPGVTALALLSLTPADDQPPATATPARALVVHGGRDAETPFAQVKRIYDALPDPKELLLLPRNTQRLHENSTEVHIRLRDWLVAWSRAT